MPLTDRGSQVQYILLLCFLKNPSAILTTYLISQNTFKSSRKYLHSNCESKELFLESNSADITKDFIYIYIDLPTMLPGMKPKVMTQVICSVIQC